MKMPQKMILTSAECLNHLMDEIKKTAFELKNAHTLQKGLDLENEPGHLPPTFIFFAILFIASHKTKIRSL